MTACGTCLRWMRLQPKDGEGANVGYCRAPRTHGPPPFWRSTLDGYVLTHVTAHGRDCAAFKPRKLK